ncbi:MAG: O-antigen ligase family protein, partial [Candidatus Omnitrophica bacterium]|nr:O-antigen ligase family protein [Candidatus Omnitrophota bacterium]
IGEEFGHFGSALNFTNILVGLAVIAWIRENRKKGEPILHSSPLNLPLILYVLVGMIGIFRFTLYGSGYLSSALIDYLQRWLIPILLYFVTYNSVKDRQIIKNIVILIMIATVIIGLISSIEYLTIGDGELEDSRVGGVADDPNLLAAFFNYYTFLFLGFLLVYFNRVRYWALTIPFLICFRGIMVTFSRAGYLAFLLASAAVVCIRSKLAFLILVFAAWFVLQNPVLLPPGIRYRLAQTLERRPAVQQATTFEDSLDQSARTRVRVWKGALWMIREHPLLGVGYNLFETKVQHYWSEMGPVDAHNTYLLIGAELGIPGLLIFLWILGVMFWSAYALYRRSEDRFAKALALGFLGGMFGFFVSNMFGSRLDSHEVSSYFWILAGLIMRLHVSEKYPDE